MGRVLVTEKLAQPGLDLMAEAGHEVDVQLELTPEQLVQTIVGTLEPLKPSVKEVSL